MSDGRAGRAGGDGPRILTQSELSAFLRCKRKWYLGSYLKLKKRRYSGSAPLSIGTLVHYGLEAYYRPDDRTHPIDAIKAKCLRMIDEFPEASNDIIKCADLAGIMLEGYMEWLEEKGADADLDVYAAEEKVEVEIRPTDRHPALGPKYILRGKMDARARRKSDDTHLQLEHKSVGNLADLPKTAQTNFQYLTYDLLAYLKSLESDATIRTDGVLLNMLRKVKRTAAAKPPFYDRH